MVATAVAAVVCVLVALAGYAGVATASESVVIPDGGRVASIHTHGGNTYGGNTYGGETDGGNTLPEPGSVPVHDSVVGRLAGR